MKAIGETVKDRGATIILKGFDPVSAGGFTQVPNVVLTNTNLSIGARVCYAMLLKYAWQNDHCYPGQLKLGEDMGIKPRMVRYYLTELKKVGYVHVLRRGLGKTNVYTLYAKPQADRQNIAGQDRQ